MSEASRGEKLSQGRGTDSTGKAAGGDDGDASILPAEAFTHGGVRKVCVAIRYPKP
jgi:hypothetical protein